MGSVIPLVSWLKRAGCVPMSSGNPGAGRGKHPSTRRYEQACPFGKPSRGKPLHVRDRPAVRPGIDAPKLWGRTVITLREANPSGMIPLRAADHRLSFNWKLEVSPGSGPQGNCYYVKGAFGDSCGRILPHRSCRGHPLFFRLAPCRFSHLMSRFWSHSGSGVRKRSRQYRWVSAARDSC